MKMDSENTIASNLNHDTRKLPAYKDLKRKNLGETYFYLNSLIKGKSCQDFDNLNEVLSQKHLTLFEESLRLILIDSLHLENEVMQILLSQNDYQINRVLKCSWFFENSLLAEDFCSKIFPYIPESFRWKLIVKVSKNLKKEDEVEKMVEFLCENYNCTFAELLLARCSSQFVWEYVKKVPAPFINRKSCRALLNVTRRFPEIGVYLLSFMCESKLGYHLYVHKKTIVHLASRHSHLFIPFFTKHFSHINDLNFGKKLSQKFGLKVKDLLFTSSDLVKSSIFNVKHLIKKLNFEEKVKFLSAYVIFKKDKLSLDNWKRSEYFITTILKKMKPKERLNIIETTFKQVYNSNFRDHPELWSEEFLELIPTNDRHFFVETLETALKEAEENDKEVKFHFAYEFSESLVFLYNCEIGFEKLKKIMSKATFISKRRIVLHSMVRNCGINRDVEGLEKLVDYVGTRHRNDDPNLLTHFLESVVDYFPKETLTLSILEKIEELAYFCALKGATSGYGRLTERLILLRMEENKNVDKYVKNFFNFYIRGSGWWRSILFDYNSPYSRELFFLYVREMIRNAEAKSQEDTQQGFMHIILLTCKEYNQHNKQNPIRVAELPGFETILRNYLKKNFELLKGENWPLDIWDKYHTDLIDSFSKSKLFIYLLKHHPEIFINNIDNLLNYLLEKSFFEEFFEFAEKYFSFYEVTDVLKETLLKKFKDESPVWIKINALTLYSFLSNADEFEQVIAEYVPQKEKIDEDQHSDFSRIQLAVPGLIKHVKPRCKNFDLIMKFFFGDFLRSVVPSYYACCQYTRPDEALAFLKDHFSKLPNRISMKKDVIRLIAGLSTRREKIEFCLKCWDENPHHSIRTILFSFLTKSFLDFPTADQFEAVKKCVLESDDIVIEARPNLERIPETFFSDYVMVLWSFSEKLPAKTRKNFRSSILWHFNETNINLLSENFIQDLIKSYLFKENSLNVENFVVSYLVSDPSVVGARTKMILDLVQNYVSKPNSISSFLKTLMRNSLNDTASFSSILSAFLQGWPSSLSVALYEDRLMLIFYNLLHNIMKSPGEDSLSISLGKELRKFLSNHGVNDLIIIVIDCLKKFFKDLANSKLDFDEIEAVKEFVAGSFDRSFIIIGISVLSDEALQLYHSDNWKDEKRQKIIKEFVEILKSHKDEIVDVYIIRKFGF